MSPVRGLLGIFLIIIAGWLVLGSIPDGATKTLVVAPFRQPTPTLLVLLLAPVLAAIGAVYIAFEVAKIRRRDDPSQQGPRPWRGLALIYPLAPLAAIALVGAALLLSRTDPGGARNAAMIFLLGAVGLIALLALLAELSSGKGVDVESHWGGLGGSLGGWSMSSPLVVLLLLLCALGGVVAIGSGDAKLANVTTDNGIASDGDVANEEEADTGANTADEAPRNATANQNAADAASSGREIPSNAPRTAIRDPNHGQRTAPKDLDQ